MTVPPPGDDGPDYWTWRKVSAAMRLLLHHDRHLVHEIRCEAAYLCQRWDQIRASTTTTLSAELLQIDLVLDERLLCALRRSVADNDLAGVDLVLAAAARRIAHALGVGPSSSSLLLACKLIGVVEAATICDRIACFFRGPRPSFDQVRIPGARTGPRLSPRRSFAS